MSALRQYHWVTPRWVFQSVWDTNWSLSGQSHPTASIQSPKTKSRLFTGKWKRYWTNMSKQIWYLVLTLKKISFLFLLKYKAESMLAGMLFRRLGKPWSSLKLVYLHTLSSVKENIKKDKMLNPRQHCTSYPRENFTTMKWIHLSENRTFQSAESEQLHWGSLAAPSTVLRSGRVCCSHYWTPSTHTDRWTHTSYAKDL